MQNWSGNYTFRAPRFHAPETLQQLQEIAAGSRKLRALGSRHSFNDIADSAEDLVSLENFTRVLALDREARTVTVEAGIRYGALGRYLHGEGFALHNLASLPHISVAGACATATHGSGDANGNLATAVVSMEMVSADGELATLSPETYGGDFSGAVAALGGLGILTALTLKILPEFPLCQRVYEGLSFRTLESQFDAIFSSAYSVSLFTDWRTENFNQIWRKSREALPDEDFFGAVSAKTDLHPIFGVSAENCTPQLGVFGPSYERLPHFKSGFTPSSGEELQSEYILPREHALEALKAVGELRESIAPLLLVSEIRSIAADTLWMSPSYERDSIGIHFTWKKDWESVRKILPQIEARLQPFSARPHWGKLFTLAPEKFPALYERLPDFRALLIREDSSGKLRNPFLDRYIFGSDAG